jgi:hypothetical protein
VKLSADIICHALSQSMQIKTMFLHNDPLIWSRPVFYEPNHPFEPHKIIVAPFNSLSAVPLKKSAALIICIGTPPEEWNNGQYSLAVIKNNKINPCAVFNIIQKLFDRYDAWEEDLRKMSVKDADIRGMVERSIEIFDNQITVVDKNLKVLAVNIPAASSGHDQWSIKSGHFIPPDVTAKARQLYKHGEKQTDPMLFNNRVISGEDMWVYRVNLFFSNQYQGCVSLSAVKHPFRPGELAVLRKFSEYIKEALHKHAMMAVSTSSSPKAMIKDLLDYLPVDKCLLRNALNQGPGKANYLVCIKVVFTESGKIVPSWDYLCATFEETLPASIAMLYESQIVLFARAKNDNTDIDDLLKAIESLLKGFDFQLGISNVFYDIIKARIHYIQAGCALTMGRKLSPQNKIYRFEKFVLPYMLSHCRGQFDVDDLLSNRLQKLKKLNQESSVDYWHTLRVYLDNNMNATQTAKEIFLHRSSLLQRLSRIYDIMGTSLNNPEEQLYIKLCMYMTEYASTPADK